MESRRRQTGQLRREVKLKFNRNTVAWNLDAVQCPLVAERSTAQRKLEIAGTKLDVYYADFLSAI